MTGRPLGFGVWAWVTAVAAPLGVAHRRYRARRGKEDPARLSERWGRAGAPRPDGPLIWIHAASVGESVSALPLVQALRAARPDLCVLVTTGTVTSAALMARRLPEGAIHQFAPADAPHWVARFLDHWRPDAALWVESEFWPNMLFGARARGVRLALVNARISDRSLRRWGRARPVVRALLGVFEALLAPNEEIKARLIALGADPARVRAVGNLKLAAAPLQADAAALEALRGALAGRPVWVAASTHPGEEEVVAAAHHALSARLPGLCTIVAPRHPERGAQIAARLGDAPLRSAGAQPGEGLYVADTMGELGLWYRLAPVAFVGGSLRATGGHNPLEPARLGVAVLSGPVIHNFRDEYAGLTAAGAARIVAPDGLADAVFELLSQPERAAAMGAAGRAALDSGEAALAATLATALALTPGARP